MLPFVHLPALPAPTAPEAGTGSQESSGTPLLRGLTIAAVVVLVGFDVIATRKPHDVRRREAVAWSVLYVALPLMFGVFLLARFGMQTGVEYCPGFPSPAAARAARGILGPLVWRRWTGSAARTWRPTGGPSRVGQTERPSAPSLRGERGARSW